MPSDPDPVAADVLQWEIWQVRWRHEDGTSKERPAVAISTSAENATRGTVLFLKITGEDHPKVPCRTVIDPSDAHFKHTGLNKRCWIHMLDDKQVQSADLRYRRGTVSKLTATFITIKLRLATR